MSQFGKKGREGGKKRGGERMEGKNKVKFIATSKLVFSFKIICNKCAFHKYLGHHEYPKENQTKSLPRRKHFI
jgi:hypothetical protein